MNETDTLRAIREAYDEYTYRVAQVTVWERHCKPVESKERDRAERAFDKVVRLYVGARDRGIPAGRVNLAVSNNRKFPIAYKLEKGAR